LLGRGGGLEGKLGGKEKSCFSYLFLPNFLCIKGEKLLFKLGLSLFCVVMHFD
jgi:hypothetical protein